jgi:hypothetical protein
MNKKMCIAGVVNEGRISMKDIFGKKVELTPTLPDGCIGISFVFESKKAARVYHKGIKDASLIRIERA